MVSNRSSQVEEKLPECQCLVKNSVVAMGSRVVVVVLVGVVLLLPWGPGMLLLCF